MITTCRAVRGVRSALAGLALTALALTACTSAVVGKDRQSPPISTVPSHSAATHPPRPTAPRPVITPPTHQQSSQAKHIATTPVHVAFFEGDDMTYGIGMPVIARFTHHVTDHRAFENAARVRLDGRAANGAWAWEASPSPDFVEEAHYRLATFWPAHSHISVALPVQGLTAGPGLVFDNSPTLSMNIGAAHISTVDFSDSAPSMTVTADGRTVRTLAVSLGTALHPTYRGTKIVEEFDRYEDMGGTSVPWSVRITTSGEFVHAAPWNSAIGRANLSHGCTNLSTVDARWFFHFSQLGDVVEYPNAPGELMPPTDGIGDWNVPWGQWSTGPFLG